MTTRDEIDELTDTLQASALLAIAGAATDEAACHEHTGNPFTDDGRYDWWSDHLPEVVLERTSAPPPPAVNIQPLPASTPTVSVELSPQRIATGDINTGRTLIVTTAGYLTIDGNEPARLDEREGAVLSQKISFRSGPIYDLPVGKTAILDVRALWVTENEWGASPLYFTPAEFLISVGYANWNYSRENYTAPDTADYATKIASRRDYYTHTNTPPISTAGNPQIFSETFNQHYFLDEVVAAEATPYRTYKVPGSVTTISFRRLFPSAEIEATPPLAGFPVPSVRWPVGLGFAFVQGGSFAIEDGNWVVADFSGENAKLLTANFQLGDSNA